MTEYTSMGM